MKLLRTLFVASSVLAISATALSAQAAQVSCKDGAKSKAGRGACSGHGGVVAAAKVDAKAVKADVKADAKVEKTAVKADAKMDKAETKTATKAAKHSKKKAKA
jgi:hypothetical protein